MVKRSVIAASSPSPAANAGRSDATQQKIADAIILLRLNTHIDIKHTHFLLGTLRLRAVHEANTSLISYFFLKLQYFWNKKVSKNYWGGKMLVFIAKSHKKGGSYAESPFHFFYVWGRYQSIRLFFSIVHPSRSSRPHGDPVNIFAASWSPLSCHCSHASAGTVNSPPCGCPYVPPWPTG